jgi:hypothetical protein
LTRLRKYATDAASSPTIATTSRGVQPRTRSASVRARKSARNSVASARPSSIAAAIGRCVRAAEGAPLERVRWQVTLAPEFDELAFEEAFTGFRRLYHIRPERVLCAPDVLQRFAALYARSADDALSRRLTFEGIGLESAIVGPGTIVFEGSVDEERMGDW